MKLSWAEIAAKLAGHKEQETEPDASPPPIASGPQLIVGLDFGTSGTKVVVRDVMAAAEDPVAIDFGTPRELGFSSFAFPSTVAIADGTLLFGTEAEQAADRAVQVHRSTKRSLLRIANLPIDTGDDSDHSEDPPLPDSVHEFLSTMYLADVLRTTWEVLGHAFPRFDRDAAIINLDVPVSSFSAESAVADTFLRILRVARILALDNPTNDVGSAGHNWMDVRRSLKPPLAAEERREDVIPEAVAAIGGLGELVKRGGRDANFVVVDIGAGTTDLGIFRFPDREARRAVFYSAITAPFGCDDVDLSICRQLGCSSPTAKELGEVRLAKSQLNGGSLQVFDFAELTEDHLREATEHLAARATQAWKRTFGEAFNKERNESRWKELDLFLIGGGSLIPGLTDPYREVPWDRVREVRVRPIDRDLSLQGAGIDSSAPQPEDMVFLLAALGLSLPPPDRPEMQHPDDVPELDLGPSRATGDYDFDAEDMYLDSVLSG
jgi:hypothetical protein